MKIYELVEVELYNQLWRLYLDKYKAKSDDQNVNEPIEQLGSGEPENNYYWSSFEQSVNEIKNKIGDKKPNIKKKSLVKRKKPKGKEEMRAS